MDISRESSELKFRVLIIGGGRWANVYISELLSMPYSVDIDIVSQTQTSFLKSKYGSRVSNYYRSCDNIPHKEKYDLAVISNQPSRRVEDISNACIFTNNLLIEKNRLPFDYIYKGRRLSNYMIWIFYTDIAFLYLYTAVRFHRLVFQSVSCL